MENPHANEGLAGSGGNRSRGSSRAQRPIEQEHTKERHSQDGHKTQVDLNATLSRG